LKGQKVSSVTLSFLFIGLVLVEFRLPDLNMKTIFFASEMARKEKQKGLF